MPPLHCFHVLGFGPVCHYAFAIGVLHACNKASFLPVLEICNIFDAFEILNRIDSEQESLDTLAKGVDRTQNTQGFAERRSK